MDAVILAAGRGQRLDDVAQPFHKPLVQIVGEPLIRRIVRQARRECDGTVVVVASPVNALAINAAIDDMSAEIVIQRKPNGPGDALRIGLAYKPLCASQRVLTLLSDNVMTDADVSDLVYGGVTCIGVKTLPIAEAERYTWFDAVSGTWFEKVKPPSTVKSVDCWVGGFTGYRSQLEHIMGFALPTTGSSGETLIGPHLSVLTDVNGRRAKMMHISAVDVGTAEAYRNFQETRTVDSGQAH